MHLIINQGRRLHALTLWEHSRCISLIRNSPDKPWVLLQPVRNIVNLSSPYICGPHFWDVWKLKLKLLQSFSSPVLVSRQSFCSLTKTFCQILASQGWAPAISVSLLFPLVSLEKTLSLCYIHELHLVQYRHSFGFTLSTIFSCVHWEVPYWSCQCICPTPNWYHSWSLMTVQLTQGGT